MSASRDLNEDPAVQRITITLDVIDEPGNDHTAVGALLDVVRHLGQVAVVPLLIRLEIGPAPTA
jgi:hypothetical protein